MILQILKVYLIRLNNFVLLRFRMGLRLQFWPYFLNGDKLVPDNSAAAWMREADRELDKEDKEYFDTTLKPILDNIQSQVKSGVVQLRGFIIDVD